ncbi:hypothetical protein [Nocardia sp. NBC_01388]|uniref:hypothetical protein n=1 Tax=Nocardia sp. NBC_01388 TaxID=2903596 RepID=UPI0032440806
MTSTAALPSLDTTSDSGAALGTSIAAALGVGESYTQSRHLYEQLYGNTRYDRTTRALTVRTYRIRALMLPVSLGVAAHAALGQRQLPIFSVGNDAIRVFLTAPPSPDDHVARCNTDLFKLAVTAVGPGTELALPTPGNDRRQWLNGLPTEDCLPTYVEVVDAVIGARHE